MVVGRSITVCERTETRLLVESLVKKGESGAIIGALMGCGACEGKGGKVSP